MAERPIYIPQRKEFGVEIKPISFEWHAGLSLAQKQRSIAALHEAAGEQGLTKLLEISTKSPDELGRGYSGFYLHYKNADFDLSIEQASDGSAVFENGGPYTDIYAEKPVEAHRDERLKNSGALIGYRFGGEQWPAEPEGAFYDWLYCHAAAQNKEESKKLSAYQGFTDIEKNPKETLACQAFSAALYVSLEACGKLEKALSSKRDFMVVTAPAYDARAAIHWK